jgi:hypothetical protein
VYTGIYHACLVYSLTRSGIYYIYGPVQVSMKTSSYTGIYLDVRNRLVLSSLRWWGFQIMMFSGPTGRGPGTGMNVLANLKCADKKQLPTFNFKLKLLTRPGGCHGRVHLTVTVSESDSDSDIIRVGITGNLPLSVQYPSHPSRRRVLVPCPDVTRT